MQNIVLYGHDVGTLKNLTRDYKVKIWLTSEDNKHRHQGFLESNQIEHINYSLINEEVTLPQCNRSSPLEFKKSLKKSYLETFLAMSIRYSIPNRDSQFVLRFFSNEYNNFYYLIDYFYEKLIDSNSQIVIFAGTPHLATDYILYIVAKELGIKTIINYQTLFENRYFCVENIEELGNLDQACSFYSNEDLPKVKKAELSALTSWYMEDLEEMTYYKRKIAKKIKALIRAIFASIITLQFKKAKKKYLAMINRYLSLNELNKYIYNYTEAMQVNLNKNDKFIYFALQMQPEKTSVPEGGDFWDQVTAIEELSKIIPSDFFIYVKENPKQDGAFRGADFFARLSKIPKVKLLPITISTYHLIEKSQVVASLTGTVGFEALTYSKPVITFGYAWYNNLPYVYPFTSELKWENIETKEFDFYSFQKSFESLMSKCYFGVVDPAYSNIVNNFSPEKNQVQLAENLRHKINQLVQN